MSKPVHPPKVKPVATPKVERLVPPVPAEDALNELNLTSAQRAEAVRMGILKYLAGTQGVATPLTALMEQVNRTHVIGLQADSDEISAAIAFLLHFTPALVAERPAMLGATRFFQATSAGVLAVERGTIHP